MSPIRLIALGLLSWTATAATPATARDAAEMTGAEFRETCSQGAPTCTPYLRAVIHTLRGFGSRGSPHGVCADPALSDEQLRAEYLRWIGQNEYHLDTHVNAGAEGFARDLAPCPTSRGLTDRAKPPGMRD